MFDKIIEYLEQREDAEYFTDSAAPIPNEEMRLLVDLRMIKAQHEIMIDALKLAHEFINKSHHLDGCQKARENWKVCTCMKDDLLVLLAQHKIYCDNYINDAEDVVTAYENPTKSNIKRNIRWRYAEDR